MVSMGSEEDLLHGVTYMRGLPGVDGAGVSVRAAPTPSLAMAGPWPPCMSPLTAGKGFKELASCCDFGGAKSFACGGGVGADVGAAACAWDRGGCEPGRGATSPLLRARRAFSRTGRVILLMRTFLAKMECWLVRRGEFTRGVEARRGRAVEVLFAVAATIGSVSVSIIPDCLGCESE